MKIFYWLHRRTLHTDMEYCRVPHHKDIYVDGGTGGADHGTKKAGTDKEALLLDSKVTSIQHLLDGILTVGTLGHHLDGDCLPLGGAATGVLQGFSAGISAAEVGEQGKGVLLPVEPPAPSADLQLLPHRRSTIIESSFIREMAPPPVEEAAVKTNNKFVHADEEKVLLEPLLGEIVEVDHKRERVTLADLLAVEHLQGEKVEPAATSPVNAPASADQSELVTAVNGGGAPKMTVVGASLPCSTKHSQALHKKLAPWKKGKEECSPPATAGKLHHRLRRMLKKKIHPEMAGDVVQACGGEQGSHGQAPHDLL